MTITLNLPPEVETRLQKRALLIGMPLSTLLEKITHDAAFADDLTVVMPPPAPQLMGSRDEWLRRFDAMSQSAPESPLLTPEATQRINIYDEEE